jgi:hypothetical protein
VFRNLKVVGANTEFEPVDFIETIVPQLESRGIAIPKFDR